MATDQINLEVQRRNLLGKKVKKLRRQGYIPATVYGKNFTSVAIQFPTSQVRVLKQAGETGIVYLTLDKQKLPTMIRHIQQHPVTNKILHVDFYKVNLKEKVKAQVPIELIGEAPIVKSGYNLVQVLHEVEVEALPADIPDSIQVDVSHLEDEGQDIRIKDLKIDTKKTELIEIDPEETIVVIEKPKEEVEEEPTEEVSEAEVKEDAGQEKKLEEKTGDQHQTDDKSDKKDN